MPPQRLPPHFHTCRNEISNTLHTACAVNHGAQFDSELLEGAEPLGPIQIALIRPARMANLGRLGEFLEGLRDKSANAGSALRCRDRHAASAPERGRTHP